MRSGGESYLRNDTPAHSALVRVRCRIVRRPFRLGVRERGCGFRGGQLVRNRQSRNGALRKSKHRREQT